MGFIVFIGIIIGVCVVGKKRYENQRYKNEIADAEWRLRMRQQSEENAQRRLIQEKNKLLRDEWNEAVTLVNKYKNEAELVIFEQKCLDSASVITLDSESFCGFEVEGINGIEFYEKKWNEYDFLIENIKNQEYLNVHAEIKEVAVDKIKEFIISSLKETKFGKEMIGKGLDVNIIYCKLCAIISATHTNKYDELLNNLKEYLDVVFSKGLIFIKQLEYGKFELPLNDPNEITFIQQHETEIKKEIRENLSHITDNEDDNFIGMIRVFNLDFLKKIAILMWYYAMRKPFSTEDFYELCGFFDEFTATKNPISERIIAEIYAKNQIGGLELVRQDIDKYNHAILEGKTSYQKYIVSALAWMELYDLELNVLKNIVNSKGEITESMQERLSFLSNGGMTNVKIFEIAPETDFFYYDSSSCEWTSKEFDVFFKKLSMKNILLNYSLSINIWRKTLPLMAGQKINNSNIYKEFEKMIQDFDGEIKCSKVNAKALDLENITYNETVLFEFCSERNRCTSMLFSCEKFGRNLNLLIITLFTPEDKLTIEDMKKYASAIKKNIYVESFRESILQSIDEVLKEKKLMYED